MVKKLNNKGGTFIWLIIFVFVFIGISTLVIDYGNLYVKAKKIKYTMNRAVKAAALQIDGSSELAAGMFKIDEDKAEETFKTILAENLGLDKTTMEPEENSLLYEKPVIKEFKVLNETPESYTSTVMNQTYDIDNPSVVATIEFKIKSTFLITDIQVSKLSSSQLTSVYE